jgi:plasmid stabilization system protein ParE
MKLRLRSVAERELAEAIIYYRDIDHALGVRFLREFETTIERLLKFPDSGHPRLGGAYRLAMVRGFPYAIAYSHSSDILMVEAVPHLKRKPNYWRDIQG